MLSNETLQNYNLIKTELDDYCLKNDRVDPIYHTAKNFLSDLLNKNVHTWINKGGTINLKYDLKQIGWDERDLTQDNAFCLLDTINAIIK